MNFKYTKFKNVIIITPKILKDNRGYFFEKINQKKFFFKICQENESLSKKKYTFRGLHFQKKPYGQKKFVSVIQGSIIDYVLCINKKDKNFGKFLYFNLNNRNKKMLYIDDNYAHGFLTMETNTIVNYKVSKFYNRNKELGINILDPTLNIKLPIKKNKMTISQKDKKSLLFKELFIK